MKLRIVVCVLSYQMHPHEFILTSIAIFLDTLSRYYQTYCNILFLDNSKDYMKMDRQYITCWGSSALSKFRRQLLADKIGAIDVQAQYLHFVALHGELRDHDLVALKKLLADGGVVAKDPSVTGRRR